MSMPSGGIDWNAVQALIREQIRAKVLDVLEGTSCVSEADRDEVAEAILDALYPMPEGAVVPDPGSE